MRVALLSCGPWGCHYNAGEYDLAIGVNRTPLTTPVDWWCFGDAEAWWWYSDKIVCQPKICTNANAAFRCRPELQQRASILWESFDAPHRLRWNVFSATAAIVLAKHLGASRLDCFGTVSLEPRPGEAQRWITEREIWNLTAAWSGLPITYYRGPE